MPGGRLRLGRFRTPLAEELLREEARILAIFISYLRWAIMVSETFPARQPHSLVVEEDQ